MFSLVLFLLLIHCTFPSRSFPCFFFLCSPIIFLFLFYVSCSLNPSCTFDSLVPLYSSYSSLFIICFVFLFSSILLIFSFFSTIFQLYSILCLFSIFLPFLFNSTYFSTFFLYSTLPHLPSVFLWSSFLLSFFSCLSIPLLHQSSQCPSVVLPFFTSVLPCRPFLLPSILCLLSLSFLHHFITSLLLPIYISSVPALLCLLLIASLSFLTLLSGSFPSCLAAYLIFLILCSFSSRSCSSHSFVVPLNPFRSDHLFL